MEFNFDTRKTLVSTSLKVSSFPLFKYANVLAQLCAYLFVVSLVLTGLSFFGVGSEPMAIKISVFLLFLTLLFWEVSLFIELKVKKLPTPLLSSGIFLDPANDSSKIPGKYNVADFLSLPSCQIVEEAIRVCKNRRLSEVGSESLLYAALKVNSDCQMLFYRLGIDVQKLQEELKNYLEKQHRLQKFSLVLSSSFQKTITKAARIAIGRGYQAIGVKELLVALTEEDTFLKKVLISYDLKEKDIENITVWLDGLERQIARSKQFWTKESLSKFGSLGKDWASGFTFVLDQFSLDWRDIVSKNIFNEIIGHKQEIDELEIVLAKSDLSNALIIGDKGIGRKSIVEALAQRCYLGTGLQELASKRVVELNMVSLTSQLQDPEKIETALAEIFQEVAAAGNIILVIDELDSFVEQKVKKPGAIDISVILAKYLAMPNFHFVGITSFEGLHQKLEQNPSFLEYFRRIEVSEISESETIMVLQSLALHIEHTYHLLVTYPAIREIINLTGRYFPSTPFPKKAIDVLSEAAVYVNSLKEKVILPRHIAKIISDKTKIPVGKMEFKEKSVLLNLEVLIHQRIINQEEAVHEISIAMRRARSGIGSKKRPMGVFLFLGPTGVGKTETAKALAEIYFGQEEKMIRLDMSEFQAISDIPRLIGQVSPVEEQGLLTTPVRENPFSLVLLDEIEKAHPNILNLFLQVFDEGHITDGQGRKVIFTNTIIISTSNAGADIIFQQVEAGATIEKDKIFDVLFQKGIFKPEFVNRFDAAVFFHSLTKENLLDIAQLTLGNLAKNLKEKDINFTITEPLKEKIVELSYKPEFGAREMRRVVQDRVENVVAEALLSDKITKGDSIEINPENFQIVKTSSS